MKSVTLRIAETLREGENIVFPSEPEKLRDRYVDVFLVRAQDVQTLKTHTKNLDLEEDFLSVTKIETL